MRSTMMPPTSALQIAEPNTPDEIARRQNMDEATSRLLLLQPPLGGEVELLHIDTVAAPTTASRIAAAALPPSPRRTMSRLDQWPDQVTRQTIGQQLGQLLGQWGAGEREDGGMVASWPHLRHSASSLHRLAASSPVRVTLP